MCLSGAIEGMLLNFWPHSNVTHQTVCCITGRESQIVFNHYVKENEKKKKDQNELFYVSQIQHEEGMNDMDLF